MMLLSGMLALEDGLATGWLAVEDGRVTAAGRGAPPPGPVQPLPGIVAPGFVDLQLNGAAGHEVTGDEAALAVIEAALIRRGVARVLATVVTTDEDHAAAAVERLGRRVDDPRSPFAGIHLEGPFLAPAHAGVHRRELLRAPADGVPAYVDHPAVRLLTLAPELPGALELVARLHRRGVVVALGHSGADADTARHAAGAGARLVTHVFNAMGPLHQRAPGLAGVALVDERLFVGVIADGVHLDPVVLEIVRRCAGDRVVLVSDASPAAAAPTAGGTLAGVGVRRGADGAVRDATGRLAGSAITLDDAPAAWARMTAATPAAAIAAATWRPARAAGLPAPWAPGTPADLVLLDERLAVARVMRAGAWLEG